ncbi:LANO_0F09780g1_1 [Lachancea nothofagi CBS 11611]|uniref:Glutamyl-tRNA(Gln) amidotransferase subunit F, mitochondrial n=1 Tax=Lachancea nothofagi CBS 11611 TaxID=1266666 RepID=A0A1G4KA52_9SACH|nr:LANO_0F09780g1_1 [Lachancea nothofagi CBS 11611]
MIYRIGSRAHVRNFVKSAIGPRFRDMTEIKKYVESPKWAVEEFLKQDDKEQIQHLPSEETVKRLLKLSGLPLENFDSIRNQLGRQLLFLDKLMTLDVDENIDPNHARILERHPQPLRYEELFRLAHNQRQEKSLGETDGSWESIKLATQSENGFYVLREALMKRE